MSLCVRIYNSGESISLIVHDPDCLSGLKLVTVSDTDSSPERVQDMTDLFYVFLLVLVTVWGLKQLLNLFSGDTSRD